MHIDTYLCYVARRLEACTVCTNGLTNKVMSLEGVVDFAWGGGCIEQHAGVLETDYQTHQ